MRKFSCTYWWDCYNTEYWVGEITKINQKEGLCEIFIKSRSSITLLIGKSESRRFACIPNRFVSCWLGNPIDVCYNIELLSNVLKNKIEVVTMAYAIREIADILCD